MRAIAINVAANTNLPGFRGPIYPDGSVEYVPIPEREPPGEPVPTYADLDLRFPIPDDVADTPVHLDPEFAGYADRDRYTYGDEHGVKAGPLSDLDAGDYLFFYATLSTHDWPERARTPSEVPAVDWIAPDWGAYLIGHFRVRQAITGAQYRDLSADEQRVFASNAHVRRADFDAKVLVEGDDASRLYDYAVPLSSPEAGTTANRLVTELSNDSGKGPWWRRRFWYDTEATREILDLSDSVPKNRT